MDALCLLAVSALSGGCQPHRQQVDRTDMRDVWRHPGAGAGVAHPGSVTIAQGPGPLVCQVQQSGTLHVMDATTGGELAVTTAQPGTIIWVDEDKGVFANKRQIRPGPLARGHEYSISVDVETANDWRTGVEAPKPAPPPASQPGAGPGR